MDHATLDPTEEAASTEVWRRAFASVGALVTAALLIALVIMVASSNRDRDAASERERHSYDVMMLTRGVDSSLARAEAALGRFVISGDRRVGTLYYNEWVLTGRQLDQLEKLVSDSPTQQRLVNELNRLYALRGTELAPAATNANYRRGWPALSAFNKAGEAVTVPAISRLLQKIQANERQLLGERSAETQRYVNRSNFLAAMLSITGLALVLVAIALGWLSVQAVAQRRKARYAAEAEADRAIMLEQAVTERTGELRDANARLQEEMAERAVAEAALLQVRKMEAVGQLTGGIAHDFNNMLAVVIAGLDLARRRLANQDEVARHIDNAMEGANRAAALTRRLLSFARSEPLLPEGVDPGRLLSGMSDLFDRTLGERISVETRGLEGLWPVWVDPHQLENAILNLAVNARDAIEADGHLLIAAANVVLAEGEIGEATAGDYVAIHVTDDGAGMSRAVLDRVFEPFFTTKPVGKGTGLGLSQIFGFVRQSRGEVAIASTEGEGTTVSLYLPRFVRDAVAASATASTEPSEPITPAAAAGQAVLVVEDDPRVLGATISGLEELGYAPIACDSGEKALGLLAQRPDIRLVISDVVMPGMTGPELIRQVSRLYPDTGILFVTGFVGDAGDAGDLAGYELLRKPFTIGALERAVAHALGPAAPPLSEPRPGRRAAAAG